MLYALLESRIYAANERRTLLSDRFRRPARFAHASVMLCPGLSSVTHVLFSLQLHFKLLSDIFFFLLFVILYRSIAGLHKNAGETAVDMYPACNFHPHEI